MNIEDIDFLPTEDLLASLFRRFDAALFIGHMARSEEAGEIVFETYGDFPTCYGLAQISLDALCRNSFPDDSTPSV